MVNEVSWWFRIQIIDELIAAQFRLAFIDMLVGPNINRQFQLS